MKRFLCGLLLVTSLVADTVTNKTIITSRDGGQFDLQRRTVHYHGEVRVVDPGGFELTCEDLVTDLAADGKGPQTITATTNVVIVLIQPPRKTNEVAVRIRATGQRAEYSGTNQLITLTGLPVFEHPLVTMWAEDAILYDVATGGFRARGKQRSQFNMELLKKLSAAGKATNEPAKNP